MPVSKKQLRANRENAKKSTGPKTAKGKAISSRNALKHGLTTRNIIFNSLHDSKDKAEFESIVKSLTDELNPQGTFQCYLVHKIAVALWRTSLLIKAETSQINKQLNNIENNKRLKMLQNQLDSYATDNIPPDLDSQYKQELSNLININSIPQTESASNLLKYEQLFDTQLIRAYHLLKQIQIEGYFESLQNHYKKNKFRNSNPFAEPRVKHGEV